MKLIEFLRRLLSRFGVLAFRAASVTEIENLLCRIRPVATGINLLRVGGDADGGYLVPDDFREGVDLVVSPGTGSNVEFETYFANRGVPCLLVDGSVSAPPIEHSGFEFVPKYLGSVDSDYCVTLDRLLEVKRFEGDAILQMDIEGAEWEVLASCSRDVLAKFRIMVIEFHDFANWTASRFTHDFSLGIIDKLLESHSVVHIHVNNCCGHKNVRGVKVPNTVEITFLRKNRFSQGGLLGFLSLPHILDRPNLAEKTSVPLPSVWTGG